jgi:hypothetical protein
MLGDIGSNWVDIGGRGRGALRPSADLGLGLGGPWATLGPRKGHPSVAHGPAKRGIAEVPLFATKVEKWRAGCEGIAEIAVIARDRESRNLPRINTDNNRIENTNPEQISVDQWWVPQRGGDASAWTARSVPIRRPAGSA